jgi:hypothetical protein
MAESPTCDRIAFAYCPPGNRTAHVPSREKPRKRPPTPWGSPFSALPFVDDILRKTGIFRVFRDKARREFSAVKTCWRRERDSNPRYGFPYSGFQDRLFQPLTHPSGTSKRNTGNSLHSTRQLRAR